MKQVIYNFIGKIDRIIVKYLGWQHIPRSNTNFMYLNPYIYKGKGIKLKDGTIVSKGDWIAELHIDNLSIKTLNTSYTNLIRLLKGEITALRECFEDEPYSKLKAIYGITIFHEAAGRQGFTILEIDNKFKKFLGSLWENILREAFKKRGTRSRRKFIFSKECWISKDQIIKL